MDEERKNTIIKEIDKLLEQVPPNNINCDMNQYMNDYIYNSSLLKRNIDHKICDDCRENHLENCENCDLYIEKKKLYHSIKSINKLSRINRIKDILKNIFLFSWKVSIQVFIILIALFGITFDSTVKSIFYERIPTASIYLREQSLKCLRTDFSREYIENELGIPSNIKEINLFEKSYFETIYVDKYYTLLCYYNDIGSLLGYMIISNRSDFLYQCYRSNIKLSETSVSEARDILEKEGIVSQLIKRDNFDGDRLDNNKYYYECKMQHSYGALEICYVGFGFTDIGHLTNRIEPNMDIENVKINFITLFKDYNFNNLYGENGYYMIDFIKDYVINECYAGISKGNLTNLSEDLDFNDKIKEYLNEYKQ